MADIITLGELLIDMTQSGADENGCAKFTAYPGGAPANVAVAAARLGADCGFIGKVGDDAFGRGLRDTLVGEGVDVSGLFFSKEHPTTMAIVSVDGSGEREFSFYRDPGADTQLTAEEAVGALKDDLPEILHIGSLSMTTSPSREACEAAVKYAKDNGAFISYDPNYRESLWESEESAIEMIKKLLPYADILKISEEEMLMLTGTDDPVEGSSVLAGYGASIVLVTLGADGVLVRMEEKTEHVPGIAVDVADTNGAGDTFLGAMLMQLAAERTGAGDGWADLVEMVRYANKAAAITCSRHGAIPAMPRADEI